MLQSVVQPLVRRVTDKGSKTLIQRAIASLRARGSDAHLWLPGGDVRTYGAELVVNGGFADATGWVNASGTDWTFNTGVAVRTATAAANGFKTAMAHQAGKAYKVTFEIVSVTNAASGISAYLGNSATAARSAVGTYTEVIVSDGASPTELRFFPRGAGGFAGSIDNISVREITSITPTITSGLTTGNYLESTGNTVGTVDNPTGLVLDALGTVGVELVDTANTIAAWTPFGSNTVTTEGDGVSITYVGGVNSTFGAQCKLTAAGGLSANLTTGTMYKLSGQAKINAGSATLYVTNCITVPSDPTTPAITSSTYSDFALYFVYTSGTPDFQVFNTLGAGEVLSIRGVSVREVTGIHLTQSTTANKGLLKQDAGSRYYWLFDATDLLTGTFPAGYESVTVIDAKSTGQVTTSAANVVGSYSIGPSYSSYGRIIIKGSITASELALYQGFANRLAGL